MNVRIPTGRLFPLCGGGESDPAEAAAVNAWLAANPADAALARAVKSHADRAESGASAPVDVEAALRRVRATINSEVATDTAAPPLTVVRGDAPRRPVGVMAPRSKPWGRVAFAAAAAVLAIVGVRAFTGAPAGVATERVIATAVGVRDSITLSDGSTVVAPGSRLTVAASFETGDRLVTLEGAAYFDVRHDEAHPFTVRSAGAEIQDVGTSFSVKTDAAGGVTVAVTHGIVAVREASAAAPSAVELRAGDRGVVSAGTVAVTRGGVVPEDMAWTRGQLSYRDASIAEIQSDLKRWYGITLQVADSSLAHLTVTMPAQADSARMISTIAALLGADAEQHGDTVILRSAGRSTIP